MPLGAVAGQRLAPLPAQTRVNWGNPLAAALFAVYMPWGWLTHSPGSQNNLGMKQGPLGYGAFGGATAAAAVPGFQSGPWSYVAVYAPVSTSAAGIGLANMAESPGNSTCDRLLGIAHTSGVYTSGTFDSANRTANATTVAASGVTAVLAVTCSESAISMWVNGLREGSTALTASGFASFVSPELVVGRSNHTAAPDVGNSVAMDGTLHFFACWRRELSAGEVAAFSADPFLLVRGS